MAVSFARVVSTKRNTLAACLLAALATSAGASQMADAVSAGAVKAHRSDSTASVIPVTSCADDGSDGTLRKAIEGAGDGDTIDMSDLSCSLITLQSGELVSPVDHLTLKGPGIDALTIDGNNMSRVLRGKAFDISDLTIAHGLLLSYTGGGCVFADGDLTLTRAKLASCLSISGTQSAAGGAAVVFGKLTMRESAIVGSTASGYTFAGGGGAFVITAALYDSVISGNSSQATKNAAYGGGLIAHGAVTLHGSTVADNNAQSNYGPVFGGGIHAQGGVNVAVLDGSTISGNVAQSKLGGGYGGGVNSGVYADNPPNTVTIEHSTIDGNSIGSLCSACSVSGGGVHSFDQINVDYSTISNNLASCEVLSNCNAHGGGLAMFGKHKPSVVGLLDATVSANKAIGGQNMGAAGTGGGIRAGIGRKIIASNSTIALNHASTSGGGVEVTSPANAVSEMNSTIVANNDTDGGPDDIAHDPTMSDTTILGAANLVMHSAMGVVLPLDTLTDDPQLMPLTTASGGSTAVHPLSSNSPAIDKGSNASALGCDQRGYPYHRVSGTAPDIGAYEEQGERHLFADAFDGFAACPPAGP